MYKSMQLTLPLDNILFGTEITISSQNITDELKNDDRYDCYTIDGAYHNQAFCTLCDILTFPIQFHQLSDYHFSISGQEKSEMIVYHSQEDYNTLTAFDLWWGRTDQHGVTTIGLRFNENLWNKVYCLLEIISCDCFPFSSCQVQSPSKLIESILSAYDNKCIFQERTYIIKHIN